VGSDPCTNWNTYRDTYYCHANSFTYIPNGGADSVAYNESTYGDSNSYHRAADSWSNQPSNRYSDIVAIFGDGFADSGASNSCSDRRSATTDGFADGFADGFTNFKSFQFTDGFATDFKSTTNYKSFQFTDGFADR
jgi:hypothetical protein